MASETVGVPRGADIDASISANTDRDASVSAELVVSCRGRCGGRPHRSKVPPTSRASGHPEAAGRAQRHGCDRGAQCRFRCALPVGRSDDGVDGAARPRHQHRRRRHLLDPAGRARQRLAGARRWGYRLWRGAESHAHGAHVRGYRGGRGPHRGPVAAEESAATSTTRSLPPRETWRPRSRPPLSQASGRRTACCIACHCALWRRPEFAKAVAASPEKSLHVFPSPEDPEQHISAEAATRAMNRMVAEIEDQQGVATRSQTYRRDPNGALMGTASRAQLCSITARKAVASPTRCTIGMPTIRKSAKPWRPGINALPSLSGRPHNWPLDAH